MLYFLYLEPLQTYCISSRSLNISQRKKVLKMFIKCVLQFINQLYVLPHKAETKSLLDADIL